MSSGILESLEQSRHRHCGAETLAVEMAERVELKERKNVRQLRSNPRRGASMNICLLLTGLISLAAMVQEESPRIPIKTKDSAEGVSAVEAKWYGGDLKRLNEEQLSDLAKGDNAEAYRMTIFPTWGNTIMVRVQKKQSGFLLVSKRLNGQAGYDAGKLVETKETQLSAEDGQELSALLADVKFFEMPTKENVRGFDGDETVFEGVFSGKYHVITRWCATAYDPKKRGLLAFNALCKFLIDKSNLSDRPRNKGRRLM